MVDTVFWAAHIVTILIWPLAGVASMAELLGDDFGRGLVKRACRNSDDRARLPPDYLVMRPRGW